MLIVIRKMAYVWGYPIGMTVMTLMTVNCTDILKWGAPLLRRPLPLQPTRRTRRTEQEAPYLCDL